MWTIKEEGIVCFLVIILFMFILFSSVQGYCVTLKGNLVTTTDKSVTGVRIFIYDWETVEQQGHFGPNFPIGQTGSSVASNNFYDWKTAEGINLDPKLYPMDRVYVLGFSCLHTGEALLYPDFFYGAYNEADYSNPGAYFRQTKWWDMSKIPKIRFDLNTFNLGSFNPPDSGDSKGYRLLGKIYGDGGHLQNVRVEVYVDRDGVPVLPPLSFYRFNITYEPDSDGYNFLLRGFTRNTGYYLRVIGNHLGYKDTFYTEEGSDEPKKLTFTGNDSISQAFELEKGAKISGYIRDENGTPVRNSPIYIVAASSDPQSPFVQSYLHDPDYQRYDGVSEITEALEYYPLVTFGYDYFGYNHFKYNSDGSYEINGLPYNDREYYLILIELQGEEPKRYPTPLFYDGNDYGVFNVKQAKTIRLSQAEEEFNVNFSLREGACIEGDINYEAKMSEQVRTVLDFTDPNFFDPNNLTLNIYTYRMVDGSPIPMAPSIVEGFGPFAVCGLPPGDYVIQAYDTPMPQLKKNYPIYPGEFYNDKPTYINAERITVDFGERDQGHEMYLALGGMLKGRILDSKGQNISNASVLVNKINAGNPLAGYHFINSEGNSLAQFLSLTDPNGRFHFWGLPAGSYTVYVNGFIWDPNTGYLPQFSDPNSSNAIMVANQASPIFVIENNSDFTILETFQLTQSGAKSGGIISGNISLDTSVSGLVTLSTDTFYLELLDADTGIKVTDTIYKFYELSDGVLPYSIIVPSDGEYKLFIQDWDGKLLQHYYRHSDEGGTTGERDEAGLLNVDHVDQDRKYLTGIDFILSTEAGEISGEVLDSGGNGVSGFNVYASQKIENGPDKGSWRSIRQAVTDSNGAFTLEGLYKGTYIFSVSDTSFPSIYPTMYYREDNQEAYTLDDASVWIYDPDSSGDPPSIVFNLKIGGKIEGKVSNEFAGTKINAYLMIDGKPFNPRSVFIDPNFNFSFSGLTPGEYVLGYLDPNQNYLPMYYTEGGFTTDLDQVNPNDITVEINTTEWVGEMSFTQPAAKIEGRIKKETVGDPEPMSNVFISLYRLSGQKEIWATAPEQFTATDSNGNYSLKGLSVGDYKIIAFDVLSEYRPISMNLTIGESDLGSVKQDVDLSFPMGWLNKKYKWTLKLEKGLNLLAYPSRILPVVSFPNRYPPYTPGYTSRFFLTDIYLIDGRKGMSLRTFTDDHDWKSISYGNAEMEGTQITGVHGSSFYLSNGQGYMLYSQEEQTINFQYFPGQTALWLKKGINMVGNVAFDPNLADVTDPNLVSDKDFTTRKMLTQMGEDASISIRTFEAKAGKWQATYWMWGKPAGAKTKVRDELGYLVTMKEDLNNDGKGWYPTKGNQ